MYLLLGKIVTMQCSKLFNGLWSSNLVCIKQIGNWIPVHSLMVILPVSMWSAGTLQNSWKLQLFWMDENKICQLADPACEKNDRVSAEFYFSNYRSGKDELALPTILSIYLLLLRAMKMHSPCIIFLPCLMCHAFMSWLIVWYPYWNFLASVYLSIKIHTYSSLIFWFTLSFIHGICPLLVFSLPPLSFRINKVDSINTTDWCWLWGNCKHCHVSG